MVGYFTTVLLQIYC